jgi:hypothetical protein
VGCTFNRTIRAVLGTQLDRNISVYVDDVVVRSKKREDHISDLRETFANLHKHGLKLNPEKCVFGVRRGKLLGCMITERGIEANPAKIEAIRRMQPPTMKRGGPEVDRPAGFAEQVYLTVSREVAPFLQGTEGLREFPMGTGTRQGFRRPQAVFGEPRSHEKLFAGGRAVAIYIM